MSERAPSEVLRDLDVSGSDDELRARRERLHAKPWRELSDAEHLEVAAIASELERRRWNERHPPCGFCGGHHDLDASCSMRGSLS